MLVMGDKFACIDRNGAGKPILPPSWFRKIIRLEGASEQTTDSLYRNFATQLANRGTADALMKFSNGNAIEVTLSVAEDVPTEVAYSTNLMKAGEYDETKYRFVTTDQVKSLSTSSYGSPGRHAVPILQDEIAPRPLKGNYLWVQGNALTAQYPFNGTNWRFGNGSRIALAEGGTLTMTPQKGELLSGTWQMEDGALYLNYGKTYGSATLGKDDSLTVEFRGPAIAPNTSKRRWTATLKKSGF